MKKSVGILLSLLLAVSMSVLSFGGIEAQASYSDESSYSTVDMFEDPYNIKGMQGVHDTKKHFYGGLEHSLINVCLDDAIFSPDSDYVKNGWVYSYEFEGETFYFTDYPLGMSIVPNCNRSDMSISVVFLLRWNEGQKDPYNNNTNFLIDAASRVPGQTYYAPNADLSTYGGRAIRAYWHYLTEWLAKNGFHIDNFILGNEVNMPNHWHYSGSTDVNVVATKYADAFYYMYEAVRKQTDVSRCSISIDHSWNHNDEGRGIGARSFLHVFNDRLAQHSSNVDWCVSAHLYPAILYETRIWTHPYGLTTGNSDSPMVDGTNLYVMTNYIRDTFGSEHRVMLTEQGFTNYYGEAAQAACLAYTYYAAMYDPMVDSFLLNAEYSGEMLDFRIDGRLAGEVYTKIGNGNTADQQWIAEVCLPVIGASSWESFIPNFGNIQSIQLPASETLSVSESRQLATTISPANKADQPIVWTSSNTNVAVVDAKGVVTAVGAGSATITATAKYAQEVTASCTVTVKQLVQSIVLNEDSLKMNVSDTFTLQATVSPENAENKAVTWKSTNNAVATVSQSGVITAVSPGSATITVTAQDAGGVSASCQVTVVRLVEGIELSEQKLDLKIQETYKLVAVVTPDNATNKALVWESSNDDVATVTQKGLVTIIGPGTAIITASAIDGSGISGSCEVTGYIEEGNPFYDVLSSQWYYPYVKKAYERGFMSGTGTHKPTGLVVFAPEKIMERAQFVQVLYSMAGKPEVSYTDRFSDVADGQWYTSAVLWAAENGITSGQPDGTFGVSKKITREQMAVMLKQYAFICGYDVSGRADLTDCLDEETISDWAVEAMAWAIDSGVMSGEGTASGIKLNPKADASRAVGATMMNAFYEKVLGNE